jgi:hypothetical protein
MIARRLAWVLAALAVGVLAGCGGEHEGPGDIGGKRLPPDVVAAREARQKPATAVGTGSPAAKRILFGDLHVHTTFSIDAFALSLPIMQGQGLHPPADACDFARYCSSLDFWSINDHAEGLTPQHWRETKESIRRCNEIAGAGEAPDLVAFLGWEWSQVGDTAANHYGHKNVIFRDLADDAVPVRPIAAPPRLLAPFTDRSISMWDRISVPLRDWANRERYLDFGRFQREVAAVPACPTGIDVHQLPDDCHEVAADPQELFEKLSQWGFDTIVIPHGTSWGLYTPAGNALDKQLAPDEHDPDKQRLIEVYSGHGNSEEYRGWSESVPDKDGNPSCPEPRANYVPCCWQAGEIIRSRCTDPASAECEERVAAARTNYAAAGLYGHLTVPGAQLAGLEGLRTVSRLLQSGFQLPPARIRAVRTRDQGFRRHWCAAIVQFRFIASSDNHSARPGTGYKEYGRFGMTETAGPPSAAWRTRLAGPDPEAADSSVAWKEMEGTVRSVRLWEGERQASYFMTGGLAAVHAEGRDRAAIWDALRRREVYGTSGDRILLWFDLINAPGGDAPMGAETSLGANPRFRVRAAGDFKQLPGCPEQSLRGLDGDRLQHLCHGECYNPSDERHLITRIEVVRIKPQASPDEPVDSLIEDPWRVYPCPPSPDGCIVEFADEDFTSSARETLYYVRAIEEPSLAVNAGGIRCKYDDAGNCVSVNPCYGDWRTSRGDDCLSMNEERAWSSPIRITPAGR